MNQLGWITIPICSSYHKISVSYDTTRDDDVTLVNPFDVYCHAFWCILIVDIYSMLFSLIQFEPISTNHQLHIDYDLMVIQYMINRIEYSALMVLYAPII